ncbi:glycoside hydrolase family 13 protein [Aulographum hederae CBS 113979]|uniref:Glycoside hydrolase family 13 protein n=1 Tax=Aulographum hederae CBS 113979 TaxID=1176131 RepID=A0A6G1HGI8_9PEZI|nr:glycoside hydrolase family 13 protein [Aulographum hederae CBS 113979]
MSAPDRKWWKDGVVYQIYPASFKDSNGDGMGDLPGIISKLDYIKDLGIDTIWVCPMYDSPQIDMGYDISDYENVYPQFGTLQDMDTLISETHARGMRIILDLVINHTSDQHAWFQESRSSKDNPKRDWYIWQPATYDSSGTRQPPNNWRSNFGGSVWTWDEATEEYFLHLFTPEQPDLNWESSACREAIYDSAMRFWLAKGVDGFRVDTVNMYSKPDLSDAPITDETAEFQFAGLQYCNGPSMHSYLNEINAVLSEYGKDKMTVGELPNTPDPAVILSYVSAAANELSMVFQFDVVDVGMGPHKFQTEPFDFTLPDFKRAVRRTQEILGAGTGDAWTTAFLENHDQARSISRFASDAPEHRVASGKMLALMLCALSGTLFVYQGQEIGMVNAPMEWPMEEYKDVDSGNYYAMVDRLSGGDPEKLAEAKRAIQYLGREHARLPISWDGGKDAGFSDVKEGEVGGKTWMRVNDDYETCNVAKQLGDPKSVLGYWKRMIQLRKNFLELLVYGAFEVVDEADEKTFCFTKTWGEQKAVVLCNFSAETVPFKVDEKSGLDFDRMEWLDSTVDGAKGAALAPYEGRIYLVE